MGKHVAGKFGYSVVYNADYEESAKQIMELALPHTMTTKPRLYALWQAVQYIESAGIEGSIVECGVWRGGSMFAAAKTLRSIGSVSRQLLLFDTFDGMTDPTSADVDPHGRTARQLLRRSRSGSLIRARATLDYVRELMARSGYPDSNVEYIVGDVLETLPREAPESIAILRLDTDWYASTRHELETLYPRLVRGGVLIIDDYGYWAGSRRAVDEYFEARGEVVYLSRVDSGCRVAIKVQS